MIDTVRLFSKEFSLREGNRFTRKVETSEETGEVLSESLFHNGDRFSADIHGGVLSVSTSLPKLLYRTSLFEVKESDFDRAVAELESRLDKSGVSVSHNNLSDFSLSRVDFCSNLRVSHSPMDYLLELTKFGMSRRDKRDIAHETISFRNSDRELEFYNKVREVSQTSKDEEVLKMVRGMPENILRVESRLKRQRVVRKLAGLSHARLENVFDLRLSRSHLLHEVESLVRNSEESQLEFDFESNLQLLDHVMRRRRRGGFREFLAVKGVENFLKEFRYDWSKIQEFLLHRYSRRQSYAILQDLRRFRSLILTRPERDLLGEVKSKLRLVA